MVFLARRWFLGGYRVMPSNGTVQMLNTKKEITINLKFSPVMVLTALFHKQKVVELITAK